MLRIVEQIQHHRALRVTEHLGQAGSRRGFLHHRGLLAGGDRRWCAPDPVVHTSVLSDEGNQRLDVHRENLIDHYSESALRERLSKIACAFPTMSSAIRVRSRSAWSCWYFFLRCSFSRPSVRVLVRFTLSVPASRARPLGQLTRVHPFMPREGPIWCRVRRPRSERGNRTSPRR